MTLDEAAQIARPPIDPRPPPDFSKLHLLTAIILAALATYSPAAAIILAAICIVWRVCMALIFSRKR